MIKTIKDKAEEKPKETIAGLFAGAGLSGITYALLSDPESVPGAVSNAFSGAMRAGMLYAPEIIGNAQYALDFVGSAMQGAEYHEMIKNSGIAVGSTAFLKVAYDSVKDSYTSLNPAQKRRLGYGVFTMVTVGALLLAEGCIGKEPVPDPVPTPTETPDSPTEQPTPEPTQNWWDEKDHTEWGTMQPELFDREVEGVINSQRIDDIGAYSIFNEGHEVIFKHIEAGAPTINGLPYDLPPGMYTELTEMYGYPKEIILERIDLDGDGKLDTTAVKYVGEDGVLEFKKEYHDRWPVSGYLGLEIGEIIKSN